MDEDDDVEEGIISLVSYVCILVSYVCIPKCADCAGTDFALSKFLLIVSNSDLYFCFGQCIKSFTFGAVNVVSK